MLATLVIGLREGLEAALIVSIIAAFLRNNGKSLLAMWAGVGLAVALSVAVGVALNLVEQALPQARQEALETVIGAIAVIFVTGMILWMSRHAANLKSNLEAEAAQALGRGSAYALAGMAFLAVLREGFETSVFLLATFSAAQSAALAATGALIGLLLAVGIGWGIYAGGVRVNLGRFFRVTGLFLILVAAGLVISALRSAHEAGWLEAGQQPTFSLAWLVAPGTIQSALITGVLGIPADPRRIEVIGWLLYLIPVTASVLWPRSRRLEPRLAARLRFGIAGVLVLAALGLVALLPATHVQLSPQVPLVGGAGDTGTIVGTGVLKPAPDGSPAFLTISPAGAPSVSLSLSNKAGTNKVGTNKTGQAVDHEGVEATMWDITYEVAPANPPATLTFDQVAALDGGRTPVGLSPARYPGPFTAAWTITHDTRVWVADGTLLDATDHSNVVVTLSDGGLRTPRTLSVVDGGPAAGDWQVSPAYRSQAAAVLTALATERGDRRFWARQLPIALILAALLLALSAGQTLARLRRAHQTAGSGTRSDRRPVNSPQGATHVPH